VTRASLIRLCLVICIGLVLSSAIGIAGGLALVLIPCIATAGGLFYCGARASGASEQMDLIFGIGFFVAAIPTALFVWRRSRRFR
jgi:hypothetical protein